LAALKVRRTPIASHLPRRHDMERLSISEAELIAHIVIRLNRRYHRLVNKLFFSQWHLRVGIWICFAFQLRPELQRRRLKFSVCLLDVLKTLHGVNTLGGLVSE